MEDRLYRVRHKATGKFMPRLDRGASHWEPTLNPQEPPLGYLAARQQEKRGPRMFTRLVDAKNAIGWWSQGAWENDYEEGYPIPEPESVKRKRPPRSADDLEIVTYALTEITDA